MRKALAGLGVLALAALAAPSANAAGTVKIGLIMSFSGQFADTATQMEDAIKLWVKQHGDTVGGKKIVFVRKDTGGINPAVAKRLCQEAIVRDKVDILAGFLLTPNALACGDVSKESKKFMVVMNAATSIITQKSPYMTRTSSTTPQLNAAFGGWAVQHGVKTVFTMVSNYGPGLDAQKAFEHGFTKAGGKVVGSTAFPTENPDFSAFVKRAKDANTDGIYIWVPGGAQPGAVGKAIAEQGIDPKKVKVLGQDVLTDDHALASMGAIAEGIYTVWNYNYNLKTAENATFLADYRKDYNRNPDIFSIGGYDGMDLIYAVLKKAGGKTDGQTLIDAAKGMAWKSPRGPVSIDPATRDIIENVYIFQVQKLADGKLNNVLVDTIPNVKNPVD
ncbi:MAG TPA: ABC transporter substrate-binding protein [Hyphomicrobiales bacterium]|nr:ABC transporter substrate-binding protein [Hyphomicrobiales bacterium]